MSTGCFRWISRHVLPPAFDLRERGWRLLADSCGESAHCARLIDAHSVEPSELRPPARRRRSLALGIHESHERALWLARGFGDALPWDTGLDEIAARAERLVKPLWAAIRSHGRLSLDPINRAALVDGRPLRLFPREFALLWRLSDEPGEAIPRSELLHDVLGLTIEPGTNSLAVHICRLRKKLHAARLSHLLVTGPGDGSYALLFDAQAQFGFGRRNALDDEDFSGEDVSVEHGPLLEEAAE